MKATQTYVQNLSRLTQQAAFDSLRKTKTRWVSKGFALQAISTDSPTPLFCVITSKKTAKLATDRNRMRRRLRAVAYEILSTSAKTANPAMSYMIVARRESLSMPMDDLRKDLKWCLKKLALEYDALNTR